VGVLRRPYGSIGGCLPVRRPGSWYERGLHPRLPCGGQRMFGAHLESGLIPKAASNLLTLQELDVSRETPLCDVTLALRRNLGHPLWNIGDTTPGRDHEDNGNRVGCPDRKLFSSMRGRTRRSNCKVERRDHHVSRETRRWCPVRNGETPSVPVSTNSSSPAEGWPIPQAGSSQENCQPADKKR